MTKFSSLMFVAVLAISQISSAHKFKTEDYCSTTERSVCAHLGYNSEFTTSAAAKFMFHATGEKAPLMENVQIYLWMPEMDHGSSAPTVEFVGKEHYLVSEAYFLMTGLWEVRADFTVEGVSHQIKIPLNILK